MKNKRKNIIISSCLILSAIIITILIKFVDVQAIGPNNSSVGFATINKFFVDTIGVNMIFYHITDWLGILPITLAISYAIIGIIQLIKRKSFKKIDKELWILGIFYVVLVILYIFFEKVIINYRPILMDGYLEASYPSSHTLLAMCLCGSAIIINRKLFSNLLSKIVNIASLTIMITIVVGRLISGVHWFSDILGGLIISIALLMSFYTIIHLFTLKNTNENISEDHNNTKLDTKKQKNTKKQQTK